MTHYCDRFSCPEYYGGQCYGGGCKTNPMPKDKDERPEYERDEEDGE